MLQEADRDRRIYFKQLLVSQYLRHNFEINLLEDHQDAYKSNNEMQFIGIQNTFCQNK